MMGSLSEEEDQFLDAYEEITSVSDLGSESVENSDFCDRIVDSLPVSFADEVWIKNPGSIHERRNKFLRWMGLGARERMEETSEVVSHSETHTDFHMETGRVVEDTAAVLRSSSFDERLSSSQSSLSCWSSDAHEFLDGPLEENLVYRFKNLDDGTEFIVDEFGQDGMVKMLREVGSNRLITVDEFERNLGLSSMVQRLLTRRKVDEECSRWVARKQVKRGWLRKLSRAASRVHGPVKAGNKISGKSYPVAVSKNQVVKVRSHRKHTKEFSALYMGQDIVAHEGSILTMKFSPDGQYLATAGEDGTVCVWQVMEMERTPEFDMLDLDPSYAYFRINNLSEIVPLHTNKDKRSKFKNLRKSDSACVIFPNKVFRILEKPLHEFHGHSGDVLDLSWSKSKYLLSSSVDKTVRLWQVEFDQCLKVFSHNDYVTSVDFHPLDDNYFISGSIDGKVRIWAVSGCKVVDWTDIREIVTAVCYNSDGMGAVIGSMNGNCRFYDASDNHLNLCSQICIQSKKKSPSKRIIGFQFSPSDPSKLMVTSADSKVRILDGVDMICKFRGSHGAGSQMSASFTSGGMHIVSASEDSHVHVWNYLGQEEHAPKSKSNRSCERFFSNNATIAIPWCGMTCERSVILNMSGALASPNTCVNFPRGREEQGSLSSIGESLRQKLSLSSPEQFSESVGRTWPEEKLPPPSSLVVSSSVCKPQYKLLKTCCQSPFSSPNAWGMVIVTAGWDGRIRCFQNYGLPMLL